MKTRISFLSIIIAGMTLTVPFVTTTHADDRVQRKDNINRYSDRDRMKTAKDSEDKLEQALKTGETKDFYRRELEKMGWQVTSVSRTMSSMRLSKGISLMRCRSTSIRTAIRRPR